VNPEQEITNPVWSPKADLEWVAEAVGADLEVGPRFSG
jgi:hypothetical protein